MVSKYPNFNIKSKLSVILLLMACFICNQAASKVSSAASGESKSVKLFGKIIDSNSADVDSLSGLASAEHQIKFIETNTKSLSYDLIYFEHLNNSLKARGPPRV